MSAVASAVIGGVVSVISGNKAADATTEAAEMGTAEQRAAREQLQKLLEPYRAAGIPALQEQMNILGLGAPGGQAAAIAQQENNPLFQEIAAQGEDAILQNASATGGLRGGNVQGALAQFRPQMLNQFIEQQYSRLGGIANQGQNSAAGVGAAGMTSANNIAELLGKAGEAKAGAALGTGSAINSTLGQVSGFLQNGGIGKIGAAF